MKKIVIVAALVVAVIICITILAIIIKGISEKSDKSIDSQKSITVTETSKSTNVTTATSKKYFRTKSQTLESSDKSDPLPATSAELQPESGTLTAVPETQPETVFVHPEPLPPEPQPSPHPEPLPPEPQPEPQPEPVPPPQPVTPSDSQTGFQADILRIVNDRRREAGVPELSGNAMLNQAAQIRASELPDNFSHTRPDGQSCFSVFDELGISAMAKGENIAAGQQTADEVMNAWMNSEGHRKNILNPDYTSLGVGLVQTSSGYNYYWTQVFAG